MTGEVDAAEAARLSGALLERLKVVAPVFGVTDAERDELAARGVGPLLDALVRTARDRASDPHLWLLIVAVTANFPNADQVRMTRRAVGFADPTLAMVAFLEASFDSAARFSSLDSRIELVRGGVLVDVDFCANNLHNTGIQRVVRQTMSRWEVNRDIRLVAWTENGGSMRALTQVEHRRVTAWNGGPEARGESGGADADHVLVVPFESVVVLPEVPQLGLCDPLAALAEFSGNRTGLVGYDAIPVVSADMVPDAETERFVRYLTIVKHAHRVAGISVAATAEFAGFGDAVEAQGLTPPTTIEITLPIALPDDVSAERPAHDDVPLILCVGSQEARKNHLAVLFAAEMLWREGFEFRLRFIGGGSLAFIRTFDRRVAELRRQGRRIEVLRGVDDSVLVSSYAEARFTVFPSLHEGYGLPVAESLARGVPVVTSDYGSTAEISVDGGCLTVDPRDDDALVDAMRSLLADEAVLERLRAECRSRPVRTWDTYADELWEGLVVPLQEGSDV